MARKSLGPLGNCPPMRRLGALLLVTLVSGCTSNGFDAQPAGIESNLFVVDNQLRAVEELRGVTVQRDGDVTVYTVDWLQWMDRNRMEILIIGAFEDVEYEYQEFMQVSARRQSSADGSRSGGSCFGTAQVAPGPGDYLLDRALGQTSVPLPSRWQGSSSHSGSADSGADSGRSEGNGSGRLDAGEWAYFAIGASQVSEQTVIRQESQWNLEFRLDGAHRLIRLPSAPYYCYYGLSEVPGTTHYSAPLVHSYQGGRLETASPYGQTNHFIGGARPWEDVGDGYSSAHLLVNGEWIPVDGDTAFYNSTTSQEPFGIAIDQWLGQPCWVAAGVPEPLVPGAWGMLPGFCFG